MQRIGKIQVFPAGAQICDLHCLFCRLFLCQIRSKTDHFISIKPIFMKPVKQRLTVCFFFRRKFLPGSSGVVFPDDAAQIQFSILIRLQGQCRRIGFLPASQIFQISFRHGLRTAIIQKTMDTVLPPVLLKQVHSSQESARRQEQYQRYCNHRRISRKIPLLFPVFSDLFPEYRKQ